MATAVFLLRQLYEGGKVRIGGRAEVGTRNVDESGSRPLVARLALVVDDLAFHARTGQG